MGRDKEAGALHRLWIAKANNEMAQEAAAKARAMLNKAIMQAVDAGLPLAEVGRAVETTGQRISQIVAESKKA